MLTVPEHWQGELKRLVADLDRAVREYDAGATAGEDVWQKYDDMEFVVMRSLFYCALAARKFKDSGRTDNAPIWSRSVRVNTRSYRPKDSLPYGATSDSSEQIDFSKLCDEIIHSKFVDFMRRRSGEDWPVGEPQINGIIVASDWNAGSRAIELRFDDFAKLINELAITELGRPKPQWGAK